MLTLLFIWIGIPATFGILALLSIEHFYLRKYLPGGYQHFEKLRKNWEIAKKIREDWRDNAASAPAAGRTDRWHLVGDAGQYLGDMASLDAAADAGQLAGDVQQAAEIAGEHRIGTGRDDLGGLVADHFVRDFRVFDAERAAKAAAHFGIGQLSEAEPINRGEELPRLRLDPELAQP